MITNLHEEIVCHTDLRLVNSPAFADCVLHIVCNRGEAGFTYYGRRFVFVRNNIAVISRPSQVSDVSVSDDFECEYIAAPDKYLHSLLPANNYSIKGGRSLFDNPVMEVSEEEADCFRRDVANICDRVSDADHRFYHELMGGLLQVMIYDLFDFHIRINDDTHITDRAGSIVTRFYALIEAGKPRTEREVAYYADMLNVTSKYLSDTLRRVSGVSASTHIHRAAVAIIIEYLKDDKYSITQIADEMQFASVSYFSRYCLKYLGVSPSQYRTTSRKVRVP